MDSLIEKKNKQTKSMYLIKVQAALSLLVSATSYYSKHWHHLFVISSNWKVKLLSYIAFLHYPYI